MSFASQHPPGRAPRAYGGYSADELRETAQLIREENPHWRLVFPVTRSARDFINGQMPALIVTYFVAVALVLAAWTVERVLPPFLFVMWLVESAASIAARILMLRHVARAPIVQVASSNRLRLLPVLAIVLAAIHWSWTATLFIGPQLTFTTVVILLTYVMLSIACLGIAPASPLICAAYLVPMWVATAWMLAASNWASASVLVALAAALGGVLWSGYYIVVSGVRRYLVRSDEVDLLMRELRVRNSEVELLRAAAAADLETRAAVFASASHDLRQRIHALKLLAHASAAGAPRKSPATRMAAAMEDLEAFVTDVLQFVRFDSGSKAERLTNVPLQAVLQAIELQFEAMAADRHVRLRTRATSLCIRTDAVMLGRVLENLVSNALKFTRKDVLVVARRIGSEACLEVWDQGEGLDVERLEGGRAPPQQHAGSSSHQDGFGLGLMIVRRLVETLGYRLEIQSRAERGTRFRVVIPSTYVVRKGKT